MKGIAMFTKLEMTIVLLLTIALAALSQAQETTTRSKQLKIQVEVSEDGVTKSTTSIIDMNTDSLRSQLNAVLDEVDSALENAMKTLEETDIEVVINKKLRQGPESLAPYYRHRTRTIPEPIDRSNRAFLGVIAEDDSVLTGARVIKVLPATAAEKAGLEVGDVIVMLDADSITGMTSLRETITEHTPGDEIEVSFKRGDVLHKQKIDLTSYSRGLAMSETQNFIDLHRKNIDHIGESEDDMSFLGVESRNDPDNKGAIIQRVLPGTSAERIGLNIGDLIYKINNASISDVNSLIETVQEIQPGQKVDVYVKRGGRRMKFSGEMGSRNMGRAGLGNTRTVRSLKYNYEIVDAADDEIKTLNQQSGESLDESNTLSPELFKVIPNPGDGIFMIHAKLDATEDEAVLHVFDARSQVLMKEVLKALPNAMVMTEVDLRDEAPGLYYFSLTQAGKSRVQKVIVH